MDHIHMAQPWFDRLVPDGLPTHTSTLISGPGGSGKPLIGNVVAAAWLRQGGSVVFMSLQYPTHEFIVAGLKSVAQLDLTQYRERIAFIELDVRREGMELTDTNHIRANLVKPEIWDKAIEEACSLVKQDGPGLLIFGSALNLLLFSPTYGKSVLERMKNTIQKDKQRTYLFSVSTTAKKEEIAELEAVADNLIQSHSMKHPFRLFMQISRMRDTAFQPDEIEVPIAAETLDEMKAVADHTRLQVIPLIQKL